jgi:hypothetical protein
MYWFWMNMPLAAAFFAAWTGMPLWLVFKRPDTGAKPRARAAPPQGRAGQTVAPEAASADGHGEQAGDARQPAGTAAEPGAFCRTVAAGPVERTERSLRSYAFPVTPTAGRGR